MEIFTKPLSVVFAVALVVGTSYGFAPNANGQDGSRTSNNHENLTDTAVHAIAVEFMNLYPIMFPNQTETLASADFVAALTNFMEGSTIPDTDDALRVEYTAHFDAELIADSNQRILSQREDLMVILNSADPDMASAQQLTGQSLHTLQDFYSHSNWVEIGHTGINAALGDPTQTGNIGTVAGPTDSTCINCNERVCVDNIRPEIITGGILTSGYVHFHRGRPIDLTPYKPTGMDKCSHGGDDDATGSVAATGGINKDTNSNRHSPHNYLHIDAANLAYDATLAYLRGIKNSVSDEVFAKYLGLVYGTSLCYIIDTTGSMSNEIHAVKELTINMTRDSASGNAPPANYVLVPFNDPSFGPLIETTDPEVMIAALSNLTANGGGDEDELFYSGTKLAIGAVRPGSTCYAFTDAPAKDIALEEEVTALALANSVTVDVFMSSTFFIRKNSDSTKRSKNTPNSVTRRRRRQTTNSYNYYTEFAQATGGQVIPTSDGDIGEAVKIIEVGLSTTEVTLLKVDGSVSAVYNVTFDENLADIVITVTGPVSTVRIHNGDGVEQIPGPTGSGSTVIKQADTTSTKLYTIAAPNPGVWTLGVTTTASYGVSVTASSLLSFSSKFVLNITDGHGGLKTKPAKPTAGEAEMIVVRIQDQGALSGAGLGSVSHVAFVGLNGAEISRLPAHELVGRKEYDVTSVLPIDRFRVAIFGTDSKGNAMTRVDPVVVITSSVSVAVSSESPTGLSVKPGESLTVNITVNNTGSADNFVVRVSDTESFLASVNPQLLTIGSSSTGSAIAVFTVPSQVSLGLVSTVTVTVTAASGTPSNYAVFRISTSSPTTDNVAPTCQIDAEGQTEPCMADDTECNTKHWYIEFTAQDSGMGLYQVKTELQHAQSNLTVTSFTQGTTNPVSGRYASDCCHPAVTVLATDALGNSGACNYKVDVRENLEENSAVIPRATYCTMYFIVCLSFLFNV